MGKVGEADSRASRSLVNLYSPLERLLRLSNWASVRGKDEKKCRWQRREKCKRCGDAIRGEGIFFVVVVVVAAGNQNYPIGQ